MDTDASAVGIGAMLSQVQSNGQEQVVACNSLLLSKAEQRYCTTRWELLAMVLFVKHFRMYLLGRQFLLCTDHGPLWLQIIREPEGQLAC